MKPATIILGAALCLTMSGAAIGDAIDIGGLARQGTVIGVTDGQLVYRAGTGGERQASLAEVQQITLEGRDDFNAAETALAAGQLAQAVQKYDAAARAAREPWAKQLIDFRKMQALDRASRLDEAWRLWRQLAGSGPVSVNLLALMPRTLGPSGSAANAAAIDLLSAALVEPVQTDTDRAIAELLLELYEVEGRDADAQRLRGGGSGQDVAPGESAEPVETVARIAGDLAERLERAVALLDRPGGPARVVETLTGDLDQYDTDLLPEALLVLGQARLRLAEAATGQEAQDLVVQAGLDFMRVAAYFPQSRQAGEALYQAGRVNQKLGNALAARRAFEAVVSGYANTDAAVQAAAALSEMESGN